jgi:hypothetical protein
VIIPTLPSFVPGRVDSETGLAPPPRGGLDLYERWRAVFDRARATQMSDEDRHPACDHSAGKIDEAASAMREPRAASLGSCAAKTAMSSVSSCVLQPALASTASFNAAMTLQGKPSAQPCVVTGEAKFTIATQAHRNAEGSTQIQPRNSGASISSVVPTNPPAIGLVPASDSINVFVHGEAVSIVVRDPALSQQQAIETAFAAARDLTGRADTLRLLTLNGRTLYRQSSVAGMQRPSCPATLAFTC